jgi:hypothetical protein
MAAYLIVVAAVGAAEVGTAEVAGTAVPFHPIHFVYFVPYYQFEQEQVRVALHMEQTALVDT